VNRIQKRFDRLKTENKKALVAFISAGDPDLDTTKGLFKVIENNGADLIELGVPFSDPLADGPVIQAASQRSLKAGTTLKKIIALVKDIRESSELPIVLMSSFNPVHVYGLKTFVEDATQAGVDGVIIPDLPPEEAGEFLPLAQAKGLDTIFLLAPTSTEDRVRLVAEKSAGFIYYVSLTGTTGTQVELAEGLQEKVAFIKNIAQQPVLVGFGISGPEQARKAAQVADGVIVGSAIVKLIETTSDAKQREEVVGRFVGEMKKALNDSP
jgi:tryptophan synthase alpha chain